MDLKLILIILRARARARVPCNRQENSPPHKTRNIYIPRDAFEAMRLRHREKKAVMLI